MGKIVGVVVNMVLNCLVRGHVRGWLVFVSKGSLDLELSVVSRVSYGATLNKQLLLLGRILGWALWLSVEVVIDKGLNSVNR